MDSFMNLEEEGRVLNLYKPVGFSSFEILRRVKKKLGFKKVGHAGTLDPLASGVLLLCIGKATRRVPELQSLRKVYRGRFILGEETPSHDAETPVQKTCDISDLSPDCLNQVKEHFSGEQQQIPPMYSAVKVKGRRAYELARKNQHVELAPKRVHISDIKFSASHWPEIDFELSCSKGTYIRSWVRDIGKYLCVGAYLLGLERIAVGPHTLEKSYHPDDLSMDMLVNG
ncbi:MAG: tRNA pseudouridine(55) synthase TruB [Cytophagales bacterium]|nr:tRNA pseudouridine(55) synthase TruB [Cytophagales bacterium]